MKPKILTEHWCRLNINLNFTEYSSKTIFSLYQQITPECGFNLLCKVVLYLRLIISNKY